MESLTGKRVLITGGASRLGGLISLGCGRAGLRTAVHYCASQGAAETVVAGIRSAGGEAEAFGANFLNTSDVEKLFDCVTDNFGLPDYLICAHAGYGEGTLRESDWPSWREEISLTGMSPFFLCREWAARGGAGAAVFLSDARITDFDRAHLPYHAAKRMQRAAMRRAAIAFAPRIRVNGAAPGLVLPPDDAESELSDRACRAAPLGVTGTPEALINAILFLLRSPFVTGQTIYVDGGRNLRGSVY